MEVKKTENKNKFCNNKKEQIQKDVLDALEKFKKEKPISSTNEVNDIVRDVKVLKAEIENVEFSKKEASNSKKKFYPSDAHEEKMIKHVGSYENPKIVFKKRKTKKVKARGDTMTIHSTSGRELIVYKILIIILSAIFIYCLYVLLHTMQTS